MRFVTYFEEGTHYVLKRMPFSHPTMKHISFVTYIPLGMMENSTVHAIIAFLLTMPRHMHAIHRGHLYSPLGVIAWGHMARMTAWKHVKQEGELFNLCGGVKKMTLKNTGLLLV